MSTQGNHPAEDPFDAVLNVESTFHNNGYNEGMKDGAHAGLVEGRGLGLQKGFEKFMESGRLASKSIIWANQLRVTSAQQQPNTTETASDTHQRCTLPSLPSNARLEKNVNSLYALVDPRVLSTENSDAAVQDFDDRLKRAQGKERIVERVIAGPKRDGLKAEASDAVS